MKNKNGTSRQAPSAREVALDVLLRVAESGSYSNLELNRILEKHKLETREKALVTELVYGTLSRLNTLDWLINRYVKQNGKNLENWVRQLLRLGFYQIYYLDKIPARAAVHEAVETAKKRGHAGIASLVNGVMRQFLRHPERAELPADLPVYQRIALEYSHPEWLVKRWLKEYGEEETRKMAAANNDPPPVTVRVNRLRTSRQELILKLQAYDPKVEVLSSPVVPEGLQIDGAGNAAHSSFFREGLYTVQDESSMLAALAVAPDPGERILDACAAPGGKTAHLAELMDNRGEIVACDIHEHKIKLIEENAKRLGINIIHPVQSDARTLGERFDGQGFDRVLVDAPCTGFGVIRRKPDIKWSKQESDITAVAAIQLAILTAVSPLVRPGGVLVYSTCTVEEEENEGLIRLFLAEHPEFSLDPALAQALPETVAHQYDLGRGFVQILPHHLGGDGFFIARLKKSK